MLRDEVADVNNLLGGVKRIQKASGWKESTQKFCINRLRNCVRLHHEIEDGTYKQSKGYTFIFGKEMTPTSIGGGLTIK